MKKQTAIIIGYGSRSRTYANYSLDHPDELEIIAMADPLENKRESAKNAYNLSDDMLFTDYKELLAKPKMADFAIIGTQDNMHLEPALLCMEKGYHLLLEKPMASTAEECKKITEAAKKYGVKVLVCHVLRFTKFWRTIKEIIERGEIGEPMSVVHMENVNNVHQSHSYVRGNWRNKELSSPMILAKCCHDTDLLQWLIAKPCKKISSFGSLTHFTAENRPEGAPDYCIDGCPHADTCYYNAVRLYYEDTADVRNGWFRRAATNKFEPTDEDVLHALKGGPYGRCVYACDNNVVDHQVVNMEFEGGCTVSFTMSCFNKGGRHIRICGTKGELFAAMSDTFITVYSFATREFTKYDLTKIDQEITGGHGGGDTGIMIDLIKYLNDEETSLSVCSIDESLDGHLIAFAAEESRVTNTIIDFDTYKKEL